MPTAGADIVFAAAVYVPPPVRVGAGHWTHPGNCDNAHGDPAGPWSDAHARDAGEAAVDFSERAEAIQR